MIGFKTSLVGVIVVGLGIGVGLGAYLSSSKTATPAAAQVPATGNSTVPATQFSAGQSGQQPVGRTVTGAVDKVGEKEFSVKEASGSASVSVRVNDQTQIRKQVAGTPADLVKGERIALRGEPGEDGTIVATSVQLVGAGETGGQMQMPAQLQPGAGQPRGQGGTSGAQSGRGGQGGQSRAPSGVETPGQGGQGIVFGTVDSVADNVITITRMGGPAGQTSPVKASVSDKTSITKTAAGDFKDVTEGVSVTVIGPRGADGVIAASSVQIVPADASQMMRRQ